MKLPFDTIILINLKRRSDKLERMYDRIQSLNLPSNIQVIRFDAIDGTSISETWLEDNGYSPHEDYYDPYRRRAMTMGEIGCAISHFEVWKLIANTDTIESALILEDDAVFQENFWEGLNEIVSLQEHTDWDLFYLSRKKIPQEPEIVVSNNIVLPSFSYWCLSYILRKEGAKKMANSNYQKALIPADEFVPIMVGTPNLSCLRYISKYKMDLLKPLGFENQIVMPENWAFMGSETEKTKVYFKNKFFDDGMDKFIVLTVATEENDKLTRFKKSCEYFGVPYKILGLGETWNGGEAENGVLKSFGGGQKINLLREELSQWDNLENHVVLFSDSYDVVVLSNPVDILHKFRLFGRPIVFSAEKTCWPDQTLESQYKKSQTDYKFLNSGGFIGYADHIYDLIKTPVNDKDDDQLYYSQKYLNSFKKYQPIEKIEDPKKDERIIGVMSEPFFDDNVKILDIGCGDGKWGFLLKDYFKNIDGIEIFEPYVERYKLNDLYNKVHVGNFLDFDVSGYDVVIMGDVFEHVSKEEMKSWLNSNIDKLKEIIVIVPFEYEQEWDGVYENRWGHHHQPNLNIELMETEYPELTLVQWTKNTDVTGKGKGFGLYVKSYNFYYETNIGLDTKQFIFQTLNNAKEDIEVDELGVLKNKITGNFPSLLHGNGPMDVKEFLGTVSNFLSTSYDSVYGYNSSEQDKVFIEKEISIGVFFHNSMKNVDQFLDQLSILKYPKNKISLRFYLPEKTFNYKIERFFKKNNQYKNTEIIINESNTDSRIDFMDNIYNSEFLLMMDSNYIFRNTKALKILVGENKRILTPMIISESKDFYNFFISDSTTLHTYSNYNVRGVWNVDFITGIVLIKNDFCKQVRQALMSNKVYSDGDWDVKLSDNLKDNNYFVYICNSNYFGTII